MVNAVSVFPGFLGLAKETTYGTPVTAAVFPPVTDLQTVDVPNYVPDTAYRGSRVEAYAQIPTQKWSTFSYGGPAFMDTIGYALKGTLGAEDVSGAGPYVHVFSLLNTGTFQPPSYTLCDYNGFEGRQLAGAVYSQVDFTLDPSQLLTYAAQGLGLASSSVSKPTQSFSAKTATAGYTGALSYAGTATTKVKSGALTIAQGVSPLIAINNSTSPQQQWAGAVTVSGSLTCYYTDDTFLTPLNSGTQAALDATYTNGADSLDLHMTDALFVTGPITRDSSGVMLITVAFSAVGNTTDANTSGSGYSAIKATLTNTTATAAY